MVESRTPGWQRLLLVLAAGTAFGPLAALVWQWQRAAGQPADTNPVRLTRVGQVESFLWSRTGPRLLLLRRQSATTDARWVLQYDTGLLEPWRGTTPAERSALIGEFGAVHPGRLAPHISPDGLRVATAFPSALSVLDRRTGKSVLLLQGEAGPFGLIDTRWIFGPVWAPDGRRLACTALEAGRRLPRAVSERIRTLPRGRAGPSPDQVEAWMRLGARVRLYVLDTLSGRATLLLDDGPLRPGDGLTRARLWLQWSPDGRRLGFLRGGDVWAVPVPPR